ncbi:hypothetical protein HYFRA_00000896 [Hymenoscyphus fraxineus]|uniref:Cytochrome P450 n=1 Tax=Hymenoscyphus fraxineus TaxID=746836 RepID=A0A9N9KUB2_9HELO|nr:hypothetical protein HYFRA_00000896 [Hymenoscyphus fraxineus]
MGKNITTCEGDEWRRHAKMIAPQFNERNYGLVWQVANSQATQMLEHHGDKALSPIVNDTGRIALNVFSSAGLGIDNDFVGAFDEVREGCEFSFRDSLASSFHNMVKYGVTPKFLYKIGPQSLKDIDRKVQDLKLYLTDMLDQAREKALQGLPPRPNLLHTVVTKTIEEKVSGAKSGATDMFLTDEEIQGNLFMIGFAGHDTTASALEYASYLLGALPEYQEWVFEELNEVFAGHDGIETLNYEACYPRLKRCLAVMYECVRKYGPASTLVKWCKDPTTITHEGQVVNIPGGTIVNINAQGLQHAEEYWGPDAMEWNPKRWISSVSETAPESKSQLLENEEFLTPPKGQFVPWSDGLRICPGKKFSHVEFVGVLSIWLWKHRIEVVPNPGESKKEARKRTIDVVNDSVMTINLGIRDRTSVKLRFVKR